MNSTPYFSDESVTLWHGDSLEVLRELPDASVDCCVTSPPYFGLRDYGEAGQYGLEESPGAFVETMTAVFSEVLRVMADDGTLWLNIGDSYNNTTANQNGQADVSSTLTGAPWEKVGGRRRSLPQKDLGPKNLLGIPWRLAFALQDAGWTLRNDIIWAKANGMPESVADRFTRAHEHVFLFSKSRRYWFDLNPVREPHAEVSLKRARPHRADPGKAAREGLSHIGTQTLDLSQMNHEGGKNPGDVWTLPTQPFPDAHFAVMPLTLAERCVQAGCKPEGVVLDPFSGSGTTGLAAARHGRKYVGIDLSRDYLDLSLKTRIAQTAIDFGGVA